MVPSSAPVLSSAVMSRKAQRSSETLRERYAAKTLEPLCSQVGPPINVETARLNINWVETRDRGTNKFDIVGHGGDPEGAAIRIAQFASAIQRDARFPLLSPELSGEKP